MKVTKIKDLRSGTKHVTVVGRVIDKKFAPSSVALARVVLEDRTGRIILNLWRNQIEQVKIGDTVRIADGFVKRWRQILELNTWGEIEVLKRAKRNDPER